MEGIALAALITSLVAAAVFVLVAWRAGRSATTAEGFYAGTDLEPARYDDTYLVTNVAFASLILVFVELGYSLRWWAFAAPVCWTAGMFWVRRLFLRNFIPTFSHEHAHKTLHSYCFWRFYSDVHIRQALAFATILAFAGTLAIEIIGLLHAFSAFNVASRLIAPLGALAVFFGLVLYARKSGFPGVVQTDTIQKFCIASCYVVLLFVVTRLVIDVWFAKPVPDVLRVAEDLAYPTVSRGLIVVAGFVVLFLPFQLCVADMWQRCYAAKWDRDIIGRMASFKNVALFAVAFTVPIILGLVAAEGRVARTEHSYLCLELAHAVLQEMPTWLGVVLTAALFAGFVAGVMSTADTLLVNAGYVYAFDWRLAAEHNRLDLGGVKDGIANTAILAILFIAIHFALPKLTLVDVGYAVFANQIAFFPVLLLAALGSSRLRKRKATILTCSVYTGMGICLAASAIGSISDTRVLVDLAPIFGACTTSMGLLIHSFEASGISTE